MENRIGSQGGGDYIKGVGKQSHSTNKGQKKVNNNVSIASGNSLHFQKNINGKITAVTLYAHGNKSLSLKTMYAGRKRADG